MKTFIKGLALVAICIVSIVACKKDTSSSTTTTTPTDTSQVAIPSNLVKIGETFVLGAQAKAVIYSEKAFVVGYNKVYVAFYDSTTNARLKDGHFELTPTMTMTANTHTGPVEGNEETAPADQLYKANVVFIMPSSVAQWNFLIHFHNHKNNLEGDGTFPITVVQPTTPVMVTFTDSTNNNSSVYISMITPTTPKIGFNDFEVVANQMFTLDSFNYVTDYSITVNPIMLSMGHSSPGNVNPTYTDIGHYKGKVAFSMSGLWRVYMTIKRKNVIVNDSSYFDFEF